MDAQALRKRFDEFRKLFRQYREGCWRMRHAEDTMDEDSSTMVLKEASQHDALRESLTESWGELEGVFRVLEARYQTSLTTFSIPAVPNPRSIFDEALSLDVENVGKWHGLDLGLSALAKAAGLLRRLSDQELARTQSSTRSVFLASAFSPAYKALVDLIKGAISGMGFALCSGATPEPSSISEKVKRMIDDVDVVVAVMTRDTETVNGRWRASEWVIQEATYALGKVKPVIRLLEDGVEREGKIFGDQEYIPLNAGNPADAIVKMIPMLRAFLD